MIRSARVQSEIRISSMIDLLPYQATAAKAVLTLTSPEYTRTAICDSIKPSLSSNRENLHGKSRLPRAQTTLD